MEPFVIGSLWGNLSDDNRATLVSTDTTFILKDDLQDVWGEVSAGVNFFNPSANTSVFAKLAVTFGDDIDDVGGKACASAGNSRPYGNSGNCLSAVVSSKPNIRLKFCKAWPAEPFTRLSMAETTMARPSMRLGNTPI
jgi:hypothetical protein